MKQVVESAIRFRENYTFDQQHTVTRYVSVHMGHL